MYFYIFLAFVSFESFKKTKKKKIAIAYMIDLIYTPVFYCANQNITVYDKNACDIVLNVNVKNNDDTEEMILNTDACSEYWNDVVDDMQQTSVHVLYGLVFIMIATIVGPILIQYGFGTAAERMNRRIRNVSYMNFIRQEVAWFDERFDENIVRRRQQPPLQQQDIQHHKEVDEVSSALSSSFQKNEHGVDADTARRLILHDATVIHSFSGEPLRIFVMSMSSIVIGLAISLYFMWYVSIACCCCLIYHILGHRHHLLNNIFCL